MDERKRLAAEMRFARIGRPEGKASPTEAQQLALRTAELKAARIARDGAEPVRGQSRRAATRKPAMRKGVGSY